jgi:Bacterial regulatory helix-turn-helix protein, lysR family
MDRMASLTAFVRVVESGGFSAAARRLSLSPTVVGNHAHALENELGVRLLNRTTRKVSLTELEEAVDRRGLPHRRHLAAKVRVFIDALVTLFAGRPWLTENSQVGTLARNARSWSPTG